MKEIKTKQAEAALTAAGFTVIRDRGKHTIWASPDGSETIAIPRHRVLSPGVVRKVAKLLPETPKNWK